VSAPADTQHKISDKHKSASPLLLSLQVAQKASKRRRYQFTTAVAAYKTFKE
jgi:hypothetical protein